MYCKRCGAPLHQGVVLCPECGARQRRQAASVRCAGCHGRVPLGLTVCPHCGRNVRPAGPRWGVWLASFVVIVLVGLWGIGKLPIERAVEEVRSTRARLVGLVQILGPVATATPGPGEIELTPQALALAAEPPDEGELVEQPAPAGPLAEEEASPAEEQPPAAETGTPVATAEAVSGTVTMEATPTGEPPTAAPTETSTATATATFTLTPAPTATPTTPPTATSTAAPPPASADRTTYKVRSGDTLSTIATRFDITWQELAAANGLTSRSVLRIGQELVIPVKGAAAATPAPAATATGIAPTATPRPPTATPPPVVELPAPVLRGPGDQTPFAGESSFIELNWQPVPGVVDPQQYQVVVRWTEQGAPEEHWWFTTAGGSRVPPWLWGRADQPARQYSWFVRVVQVTTDGQGGERVIPVSPPSAVRTFFWN